MKKLLALLLLGFVLISCTEKTGSSDSISFAMETTYPPFESVDNQGNLVGFDIDIANALCNEMQMTCEFKSVAFDSIIPGLKVKRFDAAISAMDINPERLKEVDFSQPYYDSSANFITAKKDMSIDQVKTVGVQIGSTFQKYIVEQAKQYTATPYNTLQTAVLDLKNGRIDAIFGDTAVLADWIKNGQDLHFIGDTVKDKRYFDSGFGIAVNKESTELLAKINQALDAIKANGEYQKIYDKWMKQ